MQCLRWEEFIIFADVSLCSQNGAPSKITWHLSAHAADGCCSIAHFVLSIDVMLCSYPSPASPPEQCYWAQWSMCFHSPWLWLVLDQVVLSSANCQLHYLLYLPKRVITRHGFSSCMNHPIILPNVTPVKQKSSQSPKNSVRLSELLQEQVENFFSSVLPIFLPVAGCYHFFLF